MKLLHSGYSAPMKKLLALSAVGVLALAACGDDDDDDGGDTTDVEVVATEEVTEESVVTDESEVVTETAVESVVEVTDTDDRRERRRGHRGLIFSSLNKRSPSTSRHGWQGGDRRASVPRIRTGGGGRSP